MKQIVVCRPVNNIPINGAMEYLLDAEGGVRIFDSREQAEQELRNAGCVDEEVRHMLFLESCGACLRCGSPLFKSLIPQYKYQCFTCDEDFYKCEQEGEPCGTHTTFSLCS